MNDFEDLIALDPDDFKDPTLISPAIEAFSLVLVVLVPVLGFSETAKIVRSIADVLDQQAIQNERGRNN